MLHDAHNHLQDDALSLHLDRIAATWTPQNHGHMVVNGTCEADWPRVTELARRHPFVRPSYGLHPWDVGDRSPDWFDTLKTHLNANPHAAIGEIGVDRWILDRARPDDSRLAGQGRAPLPEQGEVFLRQLALACSQNRPVTIHCLHAWSELIALLARTDVPARGFLLHAYGGPAELIAPLAARGAYFSFNGAFLDPRKSSQKAAFKLIPHDRLLVETDAPAMSLPQSWRTHKLPPALDGSPVNHPANIEAAYAGLAALLGMSLAALTAQVDANFHRLF